MRFEIVERDFVIRTLEILDQYDPSGLSFFNVNTPDDLVQAKQTLGTLGS